MRIRKICIIIVFILYTLIIVGCTPNINPSKVNNKIKIIVDTEQSYLSIGEMTTYQINQLEEPEKEGYTFIGWTTQQESKDYLKENETYDFYEGLSLYANWEVIKINYFDIGVVGTIYLTVDDEITSKETYVNGKAKISSKDYQLPSTSIEIRLRGNSSLGAPKKSYKVKFNSKVDLFGMGKDKEWALIANYYDPSLIRNFLAYRLAQAMGMEYTVDCMFVEVYLNGRHQGLYLLCETVKTGSSRVDIEVDYDSSTTDIPFLVELDMKMISKDDPSSVGIENIDFFFLNKYKNYPIACKYPKTYETKYITESQFNFIKNYMYTVYNSLDNSRYYDYIDIPSCIDFYIIQELFMNIDMDYSSVFMYRKQNGKLKFGPVWDFDISSGNCNYVNQYHPYMTMINVNGGSYLFNKLMRNADFKAEVIDRLNEIKTNILPKMWEAFDSIYTSLKNYAIMDNMIWDTLNQAYWPKPETLVGLTYLEQLNYLKDYLEEHANWLAENW